jgi:periplasmic copper chaperone A
MPRMDQFPDARNAQGVSTGSFDCARSARRTGPPGDRGYNRRVRGELGRHHRKLALGAFVSASTILSPAFAGGLTVESAWVSPNDQAGADVGLYMTIKNDADAPDALIRAACPFANFSEKRTVDVGEGGLADRAIPNIPVPAHATLTMTAKSYHVGLLQTRDKLAAGQSFTCNLSFRGAGAMEVKVTVSSAAP